MASSPPDTAQNSPSSSQTASVGLPCRSLLTDLVSMSCLLRGHLHLLARLLSPSGFWRCFLLGVVNITQPGLISAVSLLLTVLTSACYTLNKLNSFKTKSTATVGHPDRTIQHSQDGGQAISRHLWAQEERDTILTGR